MLHFEHSNGMYFVEVPVIYLNGFMVNNSYKYFKFDSRDEWFRTDLARPLKALSYYTNIKDYLDKEFNLYLRKQKLNKLNEL